MKNKLFQAGVIAAGLLCTPFFALTAFQFPAAAQSQQTIAADGRLLEYTPSNAPFLRRGSRGDAVADVQQLLRSRGFYNGAIDGIYGPQTASAIITFQRSRNLPANGAIEARTWESLIDLSNRTTTPTANSLSKYDSNSPPTVYLSIGSSGEIVQDIQSFLKIGGYYTGAIDGVYGTATASAVEAFQQRNSNLANDGIVGPRTWRAMLDAS